MILKFEDYINEFKLLLYGVFLYLDLDIEIVKVLFFLMLLDTFLGIIKAIVLTNTFSFKLLVLGFVSKLAILLIPVALALMSKGLNYDFKWFVTVIIDLLIVSDGISIFSNVIAIKTKNEVENFDALTIVLKSSRNMLINFFNNLLKSINSK
ncbi:MAG: phage holin family protein [Limnohabitans sp.]|nr:phage holin family protein [Limnohabitans sp.]